MLATGVSLGQMWHNIWSIVSIPDNVPIVLMLILVGFFAWWSFALAIRNDRLKRNVAKTADGGIVDIFYPDSERGLPDKLHVWPYLVRIEFLAAILVTVFLIVWSVALDAPTEELANANATPNPSKAPWYFLGLQEMLVYFDPWIAGVVMPTMIITGLMAIPYMDVNPKGSGYYTLRERPFAIGVFLFGFIILWVSMVAIGTLVRGPGWMWFWPWEEWDPHRTISSTNVDLFEQLGFESWCIDFAGGKFDFFGLAAVGGFMFAGMTFPYLWLRKFHPEFYARFGFVRYNVMMMHLLPMIGLLIKVVLRLALNTKYVWITPWFNI